MGRRSKAENVRLAINGNASKERAREALSLAIASKKIKRSPVCMLCGKRATTHGHHFDYDRPFDVTWLCPMCHSSVHAYVIPKAHKRGAIHCPGCGSSQIYARLGSRRMSSRSRPSIVCRKCGTTWEKRGNGWVNVNDNMTKQSGA